MNKICKISAILKFKVKDANELMENLFEFID